MLSFVCELFHVEKDLIGARVSVIMSICFDLWARVKMYHLRKGEIFDNESVNVFSCLCYRGLYRIVFKSAFQGFWSVDRSYLLSYIDWEFSLQTRLVVDFSEHFVSVLLVIIFLSLCKHKFGQGIKNTKIDPTTILNSYQNVCSFVYKTYLYEQYRLSLTGVVAIDYK